MKEPSGIKVLLAAAIVLAVILAAFEIMAPRIMPGAQVCHAHPDWCG